MLLDDNLNLSVNDNLILEDCNPVYSAHQYSQLGGYDIGYPKSPDERVVWTLRFDLGQRRFYIQSSTGISHNFLTVSDYVQVTQVTFTFDTSNNVVWAYSYIDTVTNISHIYLGSFTRGAQTPIVEIMSLYNASSPSLTLDVSRNVGVDILSPNVILFYSPSYESTVMMRQKTDGFTIEKQVATLNDNEFIVKSGMSTGRRVGVTTREAIGRVVYKTLLTAEGGLLLDSRGRPLWVSHQQLT